MMKGLIIAGSILLTAGNMHAQYGFKAIIKTAREKLPLPGTTVSVKGLHATTAADSGGIVTLKSIPSGKHSIVFSYAGLQPSIQNFIFPLVSDSLIEIFLEENESSEEEVIIRSTRTSRTIANTTTRIETIDKEELDEKNNMRPANVSMLLHESTGLQVQQTSAVSGNANIRIQGLDGRYTQLLKDGYPTFGNFASGLGILEIPPLDLQQVEIIKGPASTLYGGGAIAGVVNFISKSPTEKREHNLILNQSGAGQTNAGMYTAHKKAKFGYAMLLLINVQKAYDADKDDFSDLPRSSNISLTPRLFYYPDSTTTLSIGNSFTKGSSTGGDMHVIAGNADNRHVYFENNNTIRNTTTFELDKKFLNKNRLLFKQSIAFFHRRIRIPTYDFDGRSTNSFSDLSYTIIQHQHVLIAGINFIYDKFRQKQLNVTASQNMQSVSGGIYLQDTWDINNAIKLETGVRIDHAAYKNSYFKKEQLFVLPRISALFKWSDKLSSRVGGGLGYKVPTIFTEQTERMQYQYVLPLKNVTAERSIGGTADINYRLNITKHFQFTINQMFFYTQIKEPLILEKSGADYFFVNASKAVLTRGFETNIKLVVYNDTKFFIGYTYTDARARYLPSNQYLPLLPKSKLNLALVYERKGNYKIGLEGYFTGRQYLYNDYHTPSFWEFGLMGEKIFHKLSLFINFENLTDQRQSRYKAVVNPPYNNPGFDDIWNHQEGFILNGGLKIKW